MNGVSKLAFTGPGRYGYGSSGTTTVSESFSLSRSLSLAVEVGAAVSAGVKIPALTVGASFGASVSMESSSDLTVEGSHESSQSVVT